MRAQRLVLEIVLITALVLLTLALGCAGLDAYYAGKNYSRADTFYMALQLFLMQLALDAGKPMPASLEFARFAAPLLAGYGAARALMQIFAEPLGAFRVAHFSGHTVIAGLSRKGFDLARDLRSRKEKVVVVEWDKENDLIETVRDLGARVVLGDATEALTLRKAAAARARLLFAVCDEDGVNAEIGLLAQELAMRRPHRAPLAIYLHIENLKLADLLRRGGLSERRKAGAHVRVFNLHEFAARHVLKNFPLDGSGLAASDARHPHLVIVGFGRMGETLLLHALQSAHYANGQRLRVTAIDRQMKARSAPFVARYPAYAQVADVEFWSEDFEGAGVSSALQKLAADEKSILSVAVCLAEDGQCLAAGLRLAELFRGNPVPVLVRLDRDSGLSQLAQISHSNGSPGDNLRAFSAGGSYTSEKEIVEVDRNKLARAIHADRKARKGETAMLLAWDQLDEQSRDFYRQAADHLPVKLRALSCRAVPRDSAGEDAPPITPAELDILARMEHQRWLGMLLLAGFQLDEAAERKDYARKLHPNLKDWEQLTEAQRVKARTLVARIPAWLAGAGKRLERPVVDQRQN